MTSIVQATPRFAVVRDWLPPCATVPGMAPPPPTGASALVAARTTRRWHADRVSHASRRTVLVAVAAVGLADGRRRDQRRRWPTEATPTTPSRSLVQWTTRPVRARRRADRHADRRPAIRTRDRTDAPRRRTSHTVGTDNEPARAPAQAPSPSSRTGQRPRPRPEAQGRSQDPDWVHPMPGAATHLLLRPALGHRCTLGIDFAVPAGTPIRAVGAGTVIAGRLAVQRLRHLGRHRPRQRLPDPLRARVRGRR